MANQPTDAYGKIAHEIQEQLLIRDFSKQQLKIIYLVIRLSWWCGLKGWQYNSYKDFEVIGLQKSHIEKNLTCLVKNKVFHWFKKYKILVFNKNFDQWTVARIDLSDFKKLVHESLQNGNDVTTLCTMLLKKSNEVTEKKEQQKPDNDVIDGVAEPSKESIKESIKERIKESIKESIKERGSSIADIVNFFEGNGFGMINNYYANDINSLIDGGSKEEIIVAALKTTLDRGRRDWGYARRIISDCYNRGIITLEQFKADQLSHQQEKKQSPQHKSSSRDLTNYDMEGLYE